MTLKTMAMTNVGMSECANFKLLVNHLDSECFLRSNSASFDAIAHIVFAVIAQIITVKR